MIYTPRSNTECRDTYRPWSGWNSGDWSHGPQQCNWKYRSILLYGILWRYPTVYRRKKRGYWCSICRLELSAHCLPAYSAAWSGRLKEMWRQPETGERRRRGSAVFFSGFFVFLSVIFFSLHWSVRSITWVPTRSRTVCISAFRITPRSINHEIQEILYIIRLCKQSKK